MRCCFIALLIIMIVSVSTIYAGENAYIKGELLWTRDRETITDSASDRFYRVWFPASREEVYSNQRTVIKV